MVAPIDRIRTRLIAGACGTDVYWSDTFTFPGPQAGLVVGHRPGRKTLLIIGERPSTVQKRAWYLGGPPGIGAEFVIPFFAPGTEAYTTWLFKCEEYGGDIDGEIWYSNGGVTRYDITVVEVVCVDRTLDKPPC